MSLGLVIWFFQGGGPEAPRVYPRWVSTIYAPALAFAERYDGIYGHYLKWCGRRRYKLPLEEHDNVAK